MSSPMETFPPRSRSPSPTRWQTPRRCLPDYDAMDSDEEDPHDRHTSCFDAKTRAWMLCCNLLILIILVVCVPLVLNGALHSYDETVAKAEGVMNAACVTFDLLYDVGCNRNGTDLIHLSPQQCDTLALACNP